MSKPRGLPVTTHYAETKMFDWDSIKLKDKTGARIMEVLENVGLVEPADVTAKESLKAHHTPTNAQFAEEHPRDYVKVWFPGNDLKKLSKTLKELGVTLLVESQR